MKKSMFFILLSLMLALTACSSSTPSSGEPQGSDTSTSSEPKDLIVAFGAEPKSLDPQDATDNISYNATGLIYDNLVTFDKDMKIVPALAKEWKVSEDGKAWTFILQEGAKFHDGTAVNAEAVKATFDRVTNKDNKLARYSLYSEFIDHITAESETEVTFHLKFPFGAVLASFAHPSGGIHSPKNLEEKGKDVNKSPVGSGPFKFKEWVSGDKMVLEANPDYWGEKAKVQSITIKPVQENATRALMLETGEADVIFPVPATDVERMQGSDKFSVTVYPSSRVLYMGMNTQKAPFNDVKVRQALNYAIDKETIVNKVLLGHGKVSEAAIGELTWGFSSVGAYPYDPEKAKQLLAEAGVKEGTTIKLWTPEGRYLMDRQISEFVQASLQAVGLNVEFQKWEWGAYLDAVKNPDSGFDLFLLGWAASTNDADWGLRPLFKTGNSNNYMQFSNEQIDALLDKGMKTVNEEERKQIYEETLAAIKEQAPWLFLVELTQPVGVSNNVEGVYALNTETLELRYAVKK